MGVETVVDGVGEVGVVDLASLASSTSLAIPRETLASIRLGVGLEVVRVRSEARKLEVDDDEGDDDPRLEELKLPDRAMLPASTA